VCNYTLLDTTYTLTYTYYMAQLTIYLPDNLLKKITSLAKKESESISSWVKNRILNSIEDSWPEDYFELFGSLKDSDLSRPKELDLKNDSRREPI